MNKGDIEEFRQSLQVIPDYPEGEPPVRVQRVVRSTLELTLKKLWFDMVASGEKREEYRQPSKWILSRLEGKHYAAVRFRNGYSASSPVYVCEYLGWEFGYGNKLWGGGSTPGNPIVVIKLGRVLSAPNAELRHGSENQ